MISELRPPAKRKFDQFGVTEETLEARANFLAEGGFLKDSKILFLGDYDLTSLACLPKTENAEIWVLDIDQEVLEVVKKGSDGSVFVVQHNLVTPLPRRLVSAFDVVFTDPPYTPEGVSLFLSRSIEALVKGDRGRIILSYGSLDPTRILAVQQTILDHGLVIEELHPRFNEYIAAKTIGGISSLYVLEPSPKSRSLLRGEYSGKIYTFER